MSLKKKTLKKAISMVTALTTIVWLSGVSMFAVSVNVASAAIADGALISSNATNSDGTPTLASLDVYIVKLVGAKKFKRLILNPQVFASYQHFNWNSVQEVAQSVVDEYKTSNLIRVDGDVNEKIYGLAPDGDTGAKSWVNLTSTQFLTEGGADADSVYVINSTDSGNYTAVGDVTTVAQLTTFLASGTLPSGVVGDSTVTISAGTPASAVVAKGANNVVFTKLDFKAGAAEYTVSKIIVSRGGIANDTDVSSIKLFDGATQVGSSQAVNTVTHKATFSSLNIKVAAGTTKTITIKANISATAGTNSVILGVAQASDITTTASSLGGTFPANGNAMSIASITVGTLTVAANATPAASNINSGSTEQEVASFRFTASADEGMKVQAIKLTQVGSASATDISNIIVKYGADTLGTASALGSGSSVLVSLSPELSLNASQAKNLDVYVDVASGINTSRTVQLEITQVDDVTAIGSNSQGSVTVAGPAVRGAIMTIGQGTLTTALDASLNPSAQNYVKGTTGRDITAIKFSAGSTEGARLTQIKLTNSGTATPTDVSNFSLVKDGVEIATGSVSGTTASFTVQFGTNTVNAYDEPGLFDVLASQNGSVVVKADVSSAATNGRTIILSVAAATDVKADGLGSKMDVPAASITGTPTGSTLTITTSGALSAALSSTSSAATTIGKGVTGVSFGKYDLSATSGEDITVSSITFRTYVGAGILTTANATAGADIINMKAFIGTTQVGSTVASPSSGAGSFSINTVVPAGTTKTIEITGDVPSGTSAASLHVNLGAVADVAVIAADISSTGNASSTDLTETGSAVGNLMTISAPTITASMSSTPAASTKVKSSAGVIIGRLLLTAGSAENVKVSTIRVTFGTNGTLADVTTASTDMRNVMLYNGTTKIGETVSVITDGTTAADYANFTGITGLTVTKGQTAAIDIKVDLVNSGVAYRAGILAAANITGSGVTSAQAISSASGTFPAVGQLLTINPTGTLVTSVDSASPVNANVAVGTAGVTGVEFSKFRFTTQYEAIKIRTLVLTRTNGADGDFVKVNLYDGATVVGPDGYISSGTVTFNFATGSEFQIPADSNKVLTVKADLNGVGFGTTSADAPILGIAATTTDVTAQGVQSNTAVTDSTGALTPAAKTLYKTVVIADTDLVTVPSNSAASASSAQKVLAIKFTNGGSYDATITSLGLTVGTSATLSGTTGLKAYWNDDATQLTGGAAGSGSALANNTKYTMTITANNTVAAGTSRILYVTADTIGATTNNTFQVNVAAVADLAWTPAGGAAVTTLTKNLPLTGPSFKY